MLSYTEFRDVVKKDFLKYFPESFQDKKVEMKEFLKTNCKLDGVIIISDVPTTTFVGSPVYVEEMYDAYIENEDIDTVLRYFASIYISNMNSAPIADFCIDEILSYNFVSNRIFFSVINTEKNVELLRNVPHRDYLDLSVVYRVKVGDDSKEPMSFVINECLATTLGLNEEELFVLAYNNTKTLLPTFVKPLFDAVEDPGILLSSIKRGQACLDTDISNIRPEQCLWVISNAHMLNGAAAILYEDVLRGIADKIGDDLYIIPSSVSECIVTGSRFIEPEELLNMVKGVNLLAVPEDKVLSDSIYYYNRNTRTTSMANI